MLSKINFEIKKIENGFLLENSYFEQPTKYFKTYKELVDCLNEYLKKFEEQELR